MTELTIRPLETDDLEALYELLATSLGTPTFTSWESYWPWKHERNPFGCSPCLVAEAGGELVGLRAFMRWDWHAGQERLRAVRAVDTVTRPDWRGQGVFTRLTTELLERARRDGIELVFNTPNTTSGPGYLKMGWCTVTSVPVLMAPARPLSRRLGRRATTPSDEGEPTGLPTVAGLLERSDLETLLLDWSRDRRLHTPRGLDYLRWRYADVPGIRYHAAWSRDGAAAVILRSRRRRGLAEIGISELFLAPGRASVGAGAALLRELRRTLDSDYLAAVAARGTPERRALLRAGFLPLPKVGPRLTVRPLDLPKSLPEPTRWRNWRCSIGDLELF